jgi:hypothetical protein
MIARRLALAGPQIGHVSRRLNARHAKQMAEMSAERSMVCADTLPHRFW